jgi:hypothetical protein
LKIGEHPSSTLTRLLADRMFSEVAGDGRPRQAASPSPATTAYGVVMDVETQLVVDAIGCLPYVACVVGVGNPVGIRGCPAAVRENESRHEHWGRRSRSALGSDDR